MTARDTVLLMEVTAVLAEHGRLRCTPTIEAEEGCVRITLDVRTDDQPTAVEQLQALELLHALRYVVDIGTIRAMALRYNIDPAGLEALLHHEETD